MTNRELDVVAEQELGLVCWGKASENLTAIFRAWMAKHDDHLGRCKDTFYGANMGEELGITFREWLYRLFLRSSEEYDNHKWLTDNLK